MSACNNFEFRGGMPSGTVADFPVPVPVIHMDADAFFVSVEQASDPRLRGRPVVVGGGRRGVVCSASYEARRFGIDAPMPTAVARRRCPGLVVLPGDFEKYELFSRLLFACARDFTPLVEVGSIDEGYLDVRGNRRLPAFEIARRLQTTLRETLKIGVSFGMGGNKLVAQIAAKSHKPGAFFCVPPGAEAEFLGPLRNRWLPGVGTVLGKILDAAGLRTVGAVASTDAVSLALFAGSLAPSLLEFARGIDDRPVEPSSPSAKSLSARETFERDVTDEAFVLAVLRRAADRLFFRLREEGMRARTLAVLVRYSDFAESRRSRSFEEPVGVESLVYGDLEGLLRKAWERRVGLRMVALTLSDLYPAAMLGELDFGAAGGCIERLERVTRAADVVRKRFGRGAIVRSHDLWMRRIGGKPREFRLPEASICVGEEAAAYVAAPSGVRITSTGKSAPSAVLGFCSCYDFMNSLLTPGEIVRLAAEAGCRTVGLCDPNLHAAPEFFAAAKEMGMRPVLGARLRICGKEGAVLVRDEEGYRNLCHLLSLPEVGVEEWEERRGGLLVPPGGLRAVRCAAREDAAFLRVARSISTCTLVETPHPLKRDPFPVSFQETMDFLRGEAGVARAMEKAAGECGFDFQGGALHFPEFRPPDGSTPRDFLARISMEGLRERYGNSAGGYRQRLEAELDVIFGVGYEEYFLAVWDILQDCAERQIPWITRGSAADSMVCYCIGISGVCPVRFDLYFERFLNRERMAMSKLPDIDLDFPHDRRDEVARRIFERYPDGHVAAVGGFHTFQARSAVAEIAKALGMPDSMARRLTEHFPGHAPASMADEAAKGTSAKRGGLFDDGPARMALRMAAKLDGLPRHRKLHPCGIVLARRPIRDFCPTFENEKGCLATHFDMDAVEEAGLVKLDILAQGGLSVLRDTRMLLGGAPIMEPPRGRWEDAGVWRLVAEGRARGVHHIESPAMLSLARMCDCRDIDALVAIVSVIRPGAANTMRKSVFARRARGVEAAVYAHPSLEPILRSTHGVVAYEEHILRICVEFAGMGIGRADALRRALSKALPEPIARFRAEFFDAASAHGRLPGEVERVWALVEGFRGYAFCRAHSTAYAVEAYEAAWFKRYHPAEFLSAVLTHEKGFYSPLVYALECQLLGIDLLPPDVNCSRETYFPEVIGDGRKAVRVPLWRIKGLSSEISGRALAERNKFGPFASPHDFWMRTGAGIEEMRLLLRAGAFDSFGLSRTALVWSLHRMASWKSASGQGLLFGENPTDGKMPEGLAEPSRTERLREEFDLLGFCVSGHPEELFPEEARTGCISISQAGQLPGKRVTVCGMRVAGRSHAQQDGRRMSFVTLCDRTGFLECELFADVHQRFHSELLRHVFLRLTGVIEPMDGGCGWTLRVLHVRGICGIGDSNP